jgi:hypothetical protein
MATETTTKSITEWEPGDRVYCVARPELTGTVAERNTETAPGMVRVKWDNPYNVAPAPHPLSWWDPGDLDWYTLPAEGTKLYADRQVGETEARTEV